jgi:hypothetical protein
MNLTVVDDDVPLPPMMLMLSKHYVRVREGGGSQGGDGGDTVSMYLTSRPAEGSVVALEVFNPHPESLLIQPPGPFFLDK